MFSNIEQVLTEEKVVLQAAELHALNPRHPYLRYVLHFDDLEAQRDFMQQFNMPEYSHGFLEALTSCELDYMHDTYLKTLQEARKNPETVVPIQHYSQPEADPATFPFFH